VDGALTFRDILKKSFLEQFTYHTEPLSVYRVLYTLLFTFLVGLFIFFVYKKTFNGVLYNRTFNISLILTSMVTALIIMPITSNITLSLGMVGALSIVRFRTAIKDPIDTAFLFWAIAVGIGAGAGFFPVVIAGSLVIGLILFVMNLFKFRPSDPYILVIYHDAEASEAVKEKLPRHRLRSETVTRQGVELTVEVRVKNNNVSFLNDILAIEGVQDAALVSFNGDYVS